MISNPVFLSLGSNLGEREQNLIKAIHYLSDEIKLNQISSFYLTSPIGPQQQDFFNLALSGTTRLNPDELLSYIKKIERKIGRKPSYHWGPRMIDIDILLFNGLSIKTDSLTIPHPEMKKRRFVLEPLLEIAGNLPINNQTLFYYLNQTLGQKCEKITLDPVFHQSFPIHSSKRF